MNDRRRDPDALLVRVQAEEARSRRGKLKIFFGAAPGVGRTYTMLEAGRELAREGVDVLIGYVEPHVRPETQALVLGLELLARKEVIYRNAKLLEFDLEAALALKPELVLVDELAHTNAPGMTHAKRWQDVERLLSAGINVFTTLNVQHLESLNDVIAQITGVVVTETVPDSVFDNADEVELVDLPADDLLERLRDGKVYLPQQAERAASNYFSKGNLIALRELALRKAAEHVGAEMEEYREAKGPTAARGSGERLLVCVGPSPYSARLVRATRRMARSLRAPWIAVHVETPRDARLSQEDRDELARTLHLAEQLGGQTATISGHSLTAELIHYARERGVSKIIVGKPNRPRWKEWWQGSLVYELTRSCGDIDIYVITGEGERGAGIRRPRGETAADVQGYYLAGIVPILCTLIAWPLSEWVAAANLVMIYLLGIVVVATRAGVGPSILASVLSVAAFDFFFVMPFLTFRVSDTQYLITFAVMLATAVTIGTLTGRVAFQAEQSRWRERRTASLYAVSQQLARASTLEQVAAAATVEIASAVDGKVAILLLSPHDSRIISLGGGADSFSSDSHDEAVARWVIENGEMAGRGTATLPGARALYLPLRAAHGAVGVLAILPNASWRPIDIERLHLLETLAGLIALAVERVQLVGEAARIRVEIETERLRSSLLSAVSHDLRTPLSVIVGAASTLLDSREALGKEVSADLLRSILREGEYLSRLVGNLLDMTRLEAGVLPVRKEWQSVEDIVGAVLARMTPRLKGRSIVTRLAPELPFAPLDDTLIEQVLVNLLDNAVKYSPDASEIEISARADRNSLVVEIINQSGSLAEENCARLFEKFFRGENAAGSPGAGIGLTISKGIVELHGGTIETRRRPNGEFVVAFTLPLGEGPPEVRSISGAAEMRKPAPQA